MKRIYISSVYRTQDGQSGGSPIAMVDWETKEVLSNQEGIPQEIIRPIKGVSKSYGTRGLAWFKDRLWIAGGVSGLIEINPDTYQVIKIHTPEEIAHPHLIKVHDGLLYVTSTSRDSLVSFDGSKVIEEKKIKDMPGIPELIEPYLPDVHKTKAWGRDKLHFNSVDWDSEGNEYHTYMHCRSIFNVTKKCVVETGLSAGHDLEIQNNRLYYSSSGDRSLFSLNLNHQPPKRTCWIKKEIPEAELDARKQYAEEGKKSEFPFMALVRGIAITPDNSKLFLGVAPGNLICLDLKQHGRQIGEMKYCNAKAEQPFDILLDPRDWN